MANTQARMGYIINRLKKEAKEKDARIAELEQAQHWRPVESAPYKEGLYLVVIVSKIGNKWIDTRLFDGFKWETKPLQEVEQWKEIEPIPPPPEDKA